MGKELSLLRRKDIETGRRIEREAIVAWLRDRKEMTAFYIDYVETAQAADAIEAGEHLK